MSKEQKGSIQEGLLDKEFESFMGLDKERQEKPKTAFQKDRTNEEKSRAYKMTFRRSFHFQGYSSKQEFWWGFFLMNSLFIVTIGIAFLFFSYLQPIFLLVSPVFAIFAFIFVFANISLMVRRLADAGYHRLITIIPFIGAPILAFIPIEWWGNLSLVVLLLVPIFIMCTKPTDLAVLNNVKTWDKDSVDEAIFSE